MIDSDVYTVRDRSIALSMNDSSLHISHALIYKSQPNISIIMTYKQNHITRLENIHRFHIQKLYIIALTFGHFRSHFPSFDSFILKITLEEIS